MDELIRVRLDLQGMKMSIVKAMSARSADVQEHIGKAIDAQIEAFDFGAEARQVVGRVLQEALRTAIEDAARAAITHNPAVRERLAAVVGEALGKAL